MNHNKKRIIKIASVVFKLWPFEIFATTSWHPFHNETYFQFQAYTQGTKLSEVLIPPFFIMPN